MHLFAAGAAVLATYLFWPLLRKLKPGSVMKAAPLIEEGAKALAAWYFAVPIFPLHFYFGLAEALWEVGRRKPGPALAALLTHTSFGLAASWAFRWGRVASFGAAVALHFFWNYFIYLMQGKRGI
ncbi:MAG: hypothetical protein GX766_10165 [Firmicutes bacterium]|jgi:RsiW-degrading membrane proteinase PrsW (M82 family)|nr:hypothetical protein [Bacillota bacterium]HQD40235.1 hypothetical protein [Bacillota bacterium]